MHHLICCLLIVQSPMQRDQDGSTSPHPQPSANLGQGTPGSLGPPDPLGIRLLMFKPLLLDGTDDGSASAEDLARALKQCTQWAECARARVCKEGGAARPAENWGLLECLHWFLMLWSCIVDEWEAGRCRWVGHANLDYDSDLMSLGLREFGVEFRST